MKRIVTVAALAALLFSACGTGPARISEDLSPQELVQRAQEATDRGRYRQAMQFYQALLERHSYDPTWLATAQYEIAFINYRQGNLQEARAGLNALLEQYDAPGSQAMPEKFRVLARVVLGSMDERENR
ncbi:MAG: outer membrane protein assembly factor BamD [Treponema sp.]|nr:outer membrane protein assembly factor BamD [Treponema sp.]